MEDMTTAALQYAELKGWPVFPVSKDKRPLVAKGFHSASRDPRMIREWWRVNPDAGVALAVPEGVLVVDVDPRNGGSLPAGLPDKDGEDCERRDTRLLRGPPRTLVRRARRPSVDLKAPGKGYVILPPTPGYTWERTGPMAALPNDVLQSWTRSEPSWERSNVPGDVRYLPWEDATAYGQGAVRNQVEAVLTATNGERNNALNKAAYGVAQLAAGGELRLDPAIEKLYNAALHVGLDAEEALHTLESAVAAGLLQPRKP